MYPIITVFGKQLGVYGISAVIGLVLCAVVAWRLGKRKNIQFMDILLSEVIIGIGLMIGGHIVYGITQYKIFFYLITHLTQLSFQDLVNGAVAVFGGNVFYGGFLGGALALLILTAICKGIPRREIFDIYGVSIPLFHVFGRIGCFFGGCCYGREYYGPLAVVVHGNTVNPEINDVSRFPVQLLEAACNLILFLVLLLICTKIKRSGRVFYLYLLIYPIIRFLDEFLRGDEIRGFWGPLSTSQWISIGLFIWGIIGIIVLTVRDRKMQTAACVDKPEQNA